VRGYILFTQERGDEVAAKLDAPQSGWHSCGALAGAATRYWIPIHAAIPRMRTAVNTSVARFNSILFVCVTSGSWGRWGASVTCAIIGRRLSAGLRIRSLVGGSRGGYRRHGNRRWTRRSQVLALRKSLMSSWRPCGPAADPA
jgi:hypothetical protein